MKNALFLCLFTVSVGAMAQRLDHNDIPKPYQQGTWLVGIQGGYSNGNLMKNYLISHAQGGYFVADKLLIGLSSTQSWEWIRSAHDNILAVGPMVRYQFTRTRISPFLTAAYQVGSRKSGSSEIQATILLPQPNGSTTTVTLLAPSFPKTVYSRSFGAGVTIGITPALKLDALISWQDKVYKADDGLYSYMGVYQPQLGLSYLLGL
ncbi:hypothetical protein [Spirosoma sp.]|uniref:hypothetical protein n=1 Tax=Spirosoma sp. TaxID=1899569 RepID=UPI00260D293E|nr:hypothetical protein [Spirosoma sp.]MCX6214158.1 hypothetical protein [Spirosoma sp.]